MQSMINTISPTVGDEWNNEVKSFIDYDFYNLSSYQESSINTDSVLIIFQKDQYKIGLPIIIRKIDDTNYYDATSTYGYAGPLRSHETIPEEIILMFQSELKEFFIKDNIVSVFSRFHPLFKQEDLLTSLGEIINLSETVSIDLTLPIDEQRRSYRKGVKSDLSRLRKRGLSVYEDITKEFIDVFIEIYNDNMKRVNASESYFFQKSYFEDLFNHDDLDARLYFVKEGDKFVAASIFVFTEEIIQYHLSGTRTDSLQNSPVRLLIDHIRILGTEQGYKHFHLGGGVGSTEDALFNFKAGFSKKRNSFKIWKYIVNKKVYDDLVSQNGIVEDNGYFPLYRSNSKLL